MSNTIAASEGAAAPVPAMPPRPARPLSTLRLLQTVSTNTVGVCDEQLFDELIVRRRYGWQPVYFISDPAGVKRVLLDNFDNYPRMARMRSLFERDLGTGLLASEGETWWQHRRVVAPILDHRSIQPDIPAMVALTDRLADDLTANGHDAVVDIDRWTSHLSSQLWNLAVTGGRPDAEPLLRWLASVPRKPLIRDFIPALQLIQPRRRRTRESNEIAAHNALLYRLIDERADENYSASRDLIWRLVHSRDRKTGNPLPRTEIRDEAASLISGGVATARAMSWIWYLLSLFPDVEAKLHAEVDRVLQGGLPTADHLPSLVYTRQVIDETLRLYPPIPGMLREATAADEICGRRIPRGAVIVIMPYLIHRHRRLWPDPDGFDPERFNEANSAQRARYSYVPFAAGPRICVGHTLAMTTLLVVVSVLASRFRFRLVKDHPPVVPVGRITLQPKGGLRVNVVERRGSAI